MDELRSLAFSVLILVLPVALLIAERRRFRPKDLSLTKIDFLSTARDGLAMFALFFVVLFFEGALLSVLGLLDSEKVIGIIRAQTPFTLLLAVTLAPVGEEMLFRAFLQKRIGVTLSSLIFAGFHYGYGSVSEIVAAFTVSVLLGLEFRKKGNIYACILAHAAYNLFSIIVISYVI